MIRKVLVANRGEIACRIIRTCKVMGFATVAVFSDADERALFVELADEAVHLGESEPGESYLNMHKILEAANRTGADAIHPGYGFLAENAHFAYLVYSSGLTFIGPSAEAIEVMGDKRIARMILQNVACLPGYTGDDQSDEAFVTAAAEIGYPVMIKAAAGGGGKGMRQVSTPGEMAAALAAARRETQLAFGDDTLLLEKALPEPRHVEVQIFGDLEGNIIALGERECSIQRRHQKIIEESPSAAITSNVRVHMLETAISIAQQIGYHSAGTIEFLLDSDNHFYFMEMNTRLQVEHPVTEMVYGVDLVRWQMEVARGIPLPKLLPSGMDPMDFALNPEGHAIEVRVYAEDPANHFLPVTGRVARWQAPPLVRTDSGIRSGDVISPYYDPMIAKIIAHGETRTEAIRRLDYALQQTQLMGLRNNIAFLRRVLMHEEHLAGIISTHFLDEHADLMQAEETLEPLALIAAAFAEQGYDQHWRNNPGRPVKHTFAYRTTQHEVWITPLENGSFRVHCGNINPLVELRSVHEADYLLRVNGHQQRVTVVNAGDDHRWVHTINGTYHLRWISPFPLPGSTAEAEGSLRAPMPGQVIQVAVEPGQTVEKGDLLLIIEAMKMEHRIEAPYAGTVEAIHYRIGDTVQHNAVLLALIPADEH